LFIRTAKTIRRELLYQTRKFIEAVANREWVDFPFGRQPLADRDTYLDLFDKSRRVSYPEIDRFEAVTGYVIDEHWFHNLALHTQVVIKTSELCYQHGRILYSALSKYISDRKEDNSVQNITIWETGTARGFSSLCMAKALADTNSYGTIITFDVLPQSVPFFWNCIDDNEKPKSRCELLEPWGELVEKYLVFVQGDTRIEMPKIHSNRVNFAFLDGAHTYKDVMIEFSQIARRQRPGDMIIYDDYNPDQYPELVRAIDEICNGGDYKGYLLRANADRGYMLATKH
jgi:prepilin-type processing-associated H-X9-DG protein